MKRYLVTGFQPFGGDSLNPTELMLSFIHEDPALSKIFETQILPVEYKKAHQLILERKDLHAFDKIFSFGLAGGRSKISLERIALNWIESNQPDNAGHSPVMGPIDLSGEKAYFNKMDLTKLKKHFENYQLPVEISLSAGGYVCNHMYFQLLKANLKMDVLFIHVPYLKEQVQQKPGGMPFITREDLRKILEALAAY